MKRKLIIDLPNSSIEFDVVYEIVPEDEDDMGQRFEGEINIEELYFEGKPVNFLIKPLEVEIIEGIKKGMDLLKYLN